MNNEQEDSAESDWEEQDLSQDSPNTLIALISAVAAVVSLATFRGMATHTSAGDFPNFDLGKVAITAVAFLVSEIGGVWALGSGLSSMMKRSRNPKILLLRILTIALGLFAMGAMPALWFLG